MSCMYVKEKDRERVVGPSLTQLSRDIHGVLPSSPAAARPYRSTRSYCTPRTEPPPIDERTFRLNASRLVLRSSAASLLSGSDAFGSRKRNWTPYQHNPPDQWTKEKHTCMPTITAFRFSTGFQSSRRMFRQTFPSWSMLGW